MVQRKQMWQNKNIRRQRKKKSKGMEKRDTTDIEKIKDKVGNDKVLVS